MKDFLLDLATGIFAIIFAALVFFYVGHIIVWVFGIPSKTGAGEPYGAGTLILAGLGGTLGVLATLGIAGSIGYALRAQARRGDDE